MKKRSNLLLIGLFVFLMFNTASWVSARVEPPVEDVYTYRVYGYVKDKDTGNALSGVTVKLYKYDTGVQTYLETDTTSASGYFNFLYVTMTRLSYPDLFKLKLTRADYTTLWKSKPVNTYTNFGTIEMTNPVEKYAVLVSCGGAVGATTYDDVSDFKDILLNEFGFSEGNIEWFAGDDVTKNNVMNAVQDMANVADPNDKLVFFYEGHGIQYSGKIGYLKLPNDEKIWDYTLLDWLDDTRAPIVFVYIGACYSGTFTGDFYDSPKRGKFLVITASTYNRPTPAMIGYQWTAPPKMGSSTVPIKYNGENAQIWSFFFLPKLDSGTSLENSFSSAKSKFKTTYPSIPRWKWISVGGLNGYWIKYSSSSYAWSWNEPDPGLLNGAHPQIMDGSSIPFSLAN